MTTTTSRRYANLPPNYYRMRFPNRRRRQQNEYVKLLLRSRVRITSFFFTHNTHTTRHFPCYSDLRVGISSMQVEKNLINV